MVEDDDVARELLVVAAEQAGMRAEQASSRGEAMRVASRVRPDVVVLDRQLPDGNGWAIVEELRRRARTQPVIAIAITAHVGLTTAERALLAGCEAFFEKPCNPDAVIARARELLAEPAPTTTVRRRKLRDS